MKTARCLLLVLNWMITFLATAGDNTPAPILQHVGRDGITNVWYLPNEKLSTEPRWDPFKGDPPLSVSNAVAIARAWVAKQPGIWAPPRRVDRITINSIHEDKPPLSYVYYYTIIFRTGDFDSRACILFMDGSVLEPRVLGEGYSGDHQTRPAGSRAVQPKSAPTPDATNPQQ